MIDVAQLSKSYRSPRTLGSTLRRAGGERRLALDDVSLHVPAGAFVALLGENGAGKTTLFKLLATLATPDAGTMTVAGHDVVREAARVRELLVPVVPEERSLVWRATARENLALYAALHGIPRRERAARLDEALHVVALDPADVRQVGTYSSGMRQRLLIARALLARPRVLLLDEPTRSLDPISARDLRAFLRTELAGRRGCTVLLATHSADEAFDLSDRLAVLHHGRLLAEGSTRDIVRRFATDEYLLWTTTPAHPSLAREGAVRVEDDGQHAAPAAFPGAGEWVACAVRAPGGPADAAGLLARLTADGVAVAAFERRPLTLATLLERVQGAPRP